MTVEIGLVLLVIAAALYLFASQRLPLDVSALLIMVTLMVIPLAGDPLVDAVPWLRDRDIDLAGAFPTVTEGLSGLSSPATVTVLAMFILSAGVQRSGLMHALGRRLVPFVGSSELRLFFVLMPVVGVVSGFVNNTAAVAVTIPFVLDMSRQLGLRASRLLMPLSFFGMLGGMLTLVGTSTNILASTLVTGDDALGRSIGMFEFAPVGALVLLTGLVYFALVGRFLLPSTDLGGEDEAEEEFVVELGFPAGSGWLGASLAESGRASDAGVTVTRLIRDGASHREDAERLRLTEDDVVKVRGTTRQVADLIKDEDVVVLTDTHRNTRASGNGVLVRALVRNRLLFTGRRARTIGFWVRYRARLVGIEAQQTVSARLSEERLNVGEILLLEVAEEDMAALRRHPDLVLLSEFEDEFDARRMWLAGGIVLAVVGAAALTPLPIVVTALLGVIAMAVTECVTKDDLYSGVPWEVIFLLAGVIPLGVAMTKSGGAEWLGGLLAGAAVDWHPLVVLMALYAFTTVLTEVVSNNASVVILVPVAVSLSAELGIGVLPLVLTVMFAASTSFLSPVGYQTNAMVYGTGLYRFTDFAKVGGPLNLVLMAVTSTAIWAIWA
ncbi:SLC13 family permease [Nocardioides panacisoli]|uniref:SLC13 family permease n=1 Tax=Nocardioides panacisoli TaxID=627624 RepID=UPI001C628E95|nr:SLC13 family permease [Nocardioides panacisoli]QYJ05525.1 SLC13 family permease [Nocardioides panacisoli]